MSNRPSAAERLDHAVDEVLAGGSPGAAIAAAGLEPRSRPLADLAAALHAHLVAPPVASRFEARLGARLATGVSARDPMGWALRHPGRLIVTGAVGSAVGVGVTAYAVWRSNRRSGIADRLRHR
jgi:hypothetical protein